MASETACSYACLILQDDGIVIKAEKISTLVKVESYWPSLFAKLCEKKNIEELLLNVGVGGEGAAPAAIAAPVAGDTGAVAAPAVEEKKKDEPKEEREEEGGLFGLFD